MHEQSLIDEILSRLDLEQCEVYNISLVCSQEALTQRIQKDIDLGIRKPDVLQRSLQRLKMYDVLDTHKIDVSLLSLEETVLKIEKIISH